MLSQSPGQLEVSTDQFIESAEQQNVVWESCNGPLCGSVGLEQQSWGGKKDFYNSETEIGSYF